MAASVYEKFFNMQLFFCEPGFAGRRIDLDGLKNIDKSCNSHNIGETRCRVIENLRVASRCLFFCAGGVEKGVF